jgi:hypothetical protein
VNQLIVRGNPLVQISLLVGVILSILKVTTILKITPIIDPFDSPSYFNFKFVGGVRMPGISFIFSRLETYENIVLFQSVVACFCWLLLSQIIYQLKFNTYLQFAISILILSIGFSSQVVYLDSVINAESLNTSFMILFIACSIHFFARKNILPVLLCVVSLGLYASVKSINGITIILPLVFFIGFLFKKYSISRKFSNVVMIWILFLGFFSIFLFRNIEASPILNTSALINQRLWLVDEWKDYALTKGFPIEGRSTYLRFASRDLGMAPDRAVSEQPDYKKWYFNGGDSFIVKFMLTHPEYVAIAPLALSLFSGNFDLSTSIWGGGARGILYYEILKQDLASIWPSNLIFWNSDRSTSYIFFSIFIAVIGFTLVYSRNLSRNQKDFQLFTALLIIFALQVSYFAWWFGSTPSDIGRHQFPFGVLIRIIFLLSCLHLSQIILDKVTSRTKPLN